MNATIFTSFFGRAFAILARIDSQREASASQAGVQVAGGQLTAFDDGTRVDRWPVRRGVRRQRKFCVNPH